MTTRTYRLAVDMVIRGRDIESQGRAATIANGVRSRSEAVYDYPSSVIDIWTVPGEPANLLELRENIITLPLS